MINDITVKEYTPEGLKEAFVKMYGENGTEIRIYSSPARINIIGEHIDYNGGKVFPASINRYLYIAIRKRNDRDLRGASAFFTHRGEKLRRLAKRLH